MLDVFSELSSVQEHRQQHPHRALSSELLVNPTSTIAYSSTEPPTSHSHHEQQPTDSTSSRFSRLLSAVVSHNNNSAYAATASSQTSSPSPRQHSLSRDSSATSFTTGYSTPSLIDADSRSVSPDLFVNVFDASAAPAPPPSVLSSAEIELEELLSSIATTPESESRDEDHLSSFTTASSSSSVQLGSLFGEAPLKGSDVIDSSVKGDMFDAVGMFLSQVVKSEASVPMQLPSFVAHAAPAVNLPAPTLQSISPAASVPTLDTFSQMLNTFAPADTPSLPVMEAGGPATVSMQCLLLPSDPAISPATVEAPSASATTHRPSGTKRASELLPIDAPVHLRKAAKTDGGDDGASGSPLPVQLPLGPRKRGRKPAAKSAEEAAQRKAESKLAKRVSNTLAARRSRHRKAEELHALRERIAELEQEAFDWKSRYEQLLLSGAASL